MFYHNRFHGLEGMRCTNIFFKDSNPHNSNPNSSSVIDVSMNRYTNFGDTDNKKVQQFRIRWTFVTFLEDSNFTGTLTFKMAPHVVNRH